MTHRFIFFLNPDKKAAAELVEPIYEIEGGHPLRGEIGISGAKNAALPILAATLLTNESIHLQNIPRITDIDNMLACLQILGKQFHLGTENSIIFDRSELCVASIPQSLTAKFRGSILLFGPLLARFSEVNIPFPGGCSIGKRGIDFHIAALKNLGVNIVETEDGLTCSRLFSRLKGNRIQFPGKTVTGTENVIMAAVLAEGTTTIQNAALEPEISDLCHFPNAMGAHISGIGTETIEILGVEKLHQCQNYAIIPDRIEAGIFLVAAAMTKGSVTLSERIKKNGGRHSSARQYGIRHRCFSIIRSTSSSNRLTLWCRPRLCRTCCRRCHFEI